MSIKQIIEEDCYNRNNTELAIERLAELGANELAEFIVDAFDRGWITTFNLGIE